MTEDDKERIAQVLEKQALGLDLDAQDRWCLKMHEQHERESKTVRAVLVNDTSGFGEDQQYPEHFIDDIGFVIHTLRQEFRAEDEKLAKNLSVLLHNWKQRETAENNKLRELEKEVAMLRGELRGMREDRRNDNVVELPRSGWKHDAA
jgi:hypothetical protein